MLDATATRYLIDTGRQANQVETLPTPIAFKEPIKDVAQGRRPNIQQQFVSNDYLI